MLVLLRTLLLIQVASTSMATTTGMTDAIAATESDVADDVMSAKDDTAVGCVASLVDGECVAPAAGDDDGNVDGDENDPSATATTKSSNIRAAVKGNDRVEIVVRNDSEHRIDVHYDDGRFGNVVGTADADGGVVRISSFVSHRFFITIHGVREGLVNPDNDEQHSFVVRPRGGDEDVDHDHDHRDDNDHDEQLFVVPSNASPSKNICKDRYPVCKQEAEGGECRRNPGWMIVNCCNSCEDVEGYGYLIDSDVRCDPRRLNATIPAWRPGSLDDLFARWATDDKYSIYGPRAISSPGRSHNAEHDGPWVFVFDDFITDYEIEQLLHGATFGHGFMRSTDQGKVVGESGERVKLTSSTRTSENAWCTKRCEELPGVMSVTGRIEEVRCVKNSRESKSAYDDRLCSFLPSSEESSRLHPTSSSATVQVTGIPQSHYESFQILRYEEGQVRS